MHTLKMYNNNYLEDYNHDVVSYMSFLLYLHAENLFHHKDHEICSQVIRSEKKL